MVELKVKSGQTNRVKYRVWLTHAALQSDGLCQDMAFDGFTRVVADVYVSNLDPTGQPLNLSVTPNFFIAFPKTYAGGDCDAWMRDHAGLFEQGGYADPNNNALCRVGMLRANVAPQRGGTGGYNGAPIGVGPDTNTAPETHLSVGYLYKVSAVSDQIPASVRAGDLTLEVNDSNGMSYTVLIGTIPVNVGK